MKHILEDILINPEPVLTAFVVAFTAILQAKTGFLF